MEAKNLASQQRYISLQSGFLYATKQDINFIIAYIYFFLYLYALL
jgi:hypothetical protein